MASRSQTQTVLVLGANGKVGQMLRAAWTESPGSSVDFVYCSRTAGKHPDDIVWAPGSDADCFPQVDAVVALWGAVAGSGRVLDSNSVLAQAAVDLAEQLGAARILHCSSAAVYRPGGVPLTEEDEAEPPSDYGKSKRAMERVIDAARAKPKAASMVSMRIANVAGADSLFANMKPAGTLRLDRFPNGQGPFRSYIGPADLARAIIALIHAKDVQGPINIAAPTVTGMEDLAKVAGCQVTWQDAPPQAIPSVCLDTSKLSKIVAFSNKTSDATYLVDSAKAGGVWP